MLFQPTALRFARNRTGSHVVLDILLYDAFGYDIRRCEIICFGKRCCSEIMTTYSIVNYYIGYMIINLFNLCV